MGSSSLSSECVLKIKYTQESHDSNSDANDDIVIVEEMEDKNSKCVMWNFRPKIQRKDEEEKEDETHREFLFVVDRSGSMSGARIRAARRALSLFLHSLPFSSSSPLLFNIIGFGSSVSSLFSSSRPYTQNNIRKAEEWIQKCEADMGGTQNAIA